jgi:hypothetical protein
VTKDGNVAQVRAVSHAALQNIPAMLPGVVCVQYVKRGKKMHAYHARFWRERGKLRKQYVRKADVEAVRAACAARQEREGERMKTRALMVAAFGKAAVEAQLRQIHRTIREAVGENVPSTYKQGGHTATRHGSL